MDSAAMNGKKLKTGSFQGLGLSKDLLKAISRLKYNTPTPIQRKTLPLALAGVDCVCMARTGSGKTAAFLIPMIARLDSHVPNTGVRGLVLSPTRELAIQTLKFCRELAKFTDLRVMSVLGGDTLDGQFTNLANHPDILIATPGRMAHLLREIPTFTLKNSVKMLVFDEADRLFEMGFAEQLHEITNACARERQTLLFSATMPKSLIQFSRAGLRDPQLLRLDADAQLSEELRLAFFTVRGDNEKLAALLYLVKKVIPTDQLTIIFTATRHHSELLQSLFDLIGVKATVVYGTMDMDAREQHLKMFRCGSVRYLIVTDLAARGIDVPLLNNVINFHFPAAPKLFVHRCGRAARQGRIGYAFSIVEPEELPFVVDVHNFLGKKLDLCDGLAVASNKAPAPATADSSADSSDDESVDGINSVGEKSIDIADVDSDEEGISDEVHAALSSNQSVTSEAISAPNATTVAVVDPYTLSSMTPSQIHIGSIPQDLVDRENDFVLRCLQSDDSLQMMKRVSENGMKQYRRTRAEPSRNGLKCAKDLIKNARVRHFHPLIAGCDPQHCNVMIAAKNDYVRMLQTFRPEQTVFETGIGTGTISASAATSKATSGSFPQARNKTKLAHSAEMMRAFRKTTVHSLERNRKAAAELAKQLIGTADVDADADVDVDTLGGSGSGADDGNSYAAAQSSSRVANTAGATNKAKQLQSKVRLSITERRKLKKKGLNADAVSKIAQSKARADDQQSLMEVQQLTSSTGQSQGSGSDGYGAYKDPKYYMAYGEGEEAENGDFTEELMQPHSALRGAESLNAMRMDSAMLDISPDDAMDLNNKRRMLRWDAKKRKFVKQTLAEMAESKSSGSKRIRSESGVNISSKSKREQGELYDKWKKRTRREIGGGEDTPDFDEKPNFKHNRGVREELRSVEQVRKTQEKKKDMQLKNMPKEKRKKIEAALRKKRMAAGQKTNLLRMNAAGVRRKARVIVRT